LDKRFLNITVEIGIRSIVGCMPEEWWQKIWGAVKWKCVRSQNILRNISYLKSNLQNC
jgi:hypothetical protein